MLRTFVFTSSLILTATTTFSAECTVEQLSDINTESASIAQALIEEQFLGGKNITQEVLGCDFNTDSQEFSADIKIRWNGVLMSWNNYELTGRMNFSNSDGEVRFTAVSANDKVQELRFWGNVANRGIELARN